MPIASDSTKIYNKLNEKTNKTTIREENSD
jgi:hypothetical protein